ncbi:MAG: MauE/DoxX family redox-associated membrane protein [Pseudomonadota bacterium]
MNTLTSDFDISDLTNSENHTQKKQSCCQSKKAQHENKTLQQNKVLSFFFQYQPIVVIAFTALFGAYLLSLSKTGEFNSYIFMHSMMGLFLLPLALLKLFNLNGFVASFAHYDILTKIWRPYGYLYPFIELALALTFIAGIWLDAAYSITLFVMGVGSIGIIFQLVQGNKIDCACVGAIVKVPLGLVSILENVGMVIMAAIMISLH